MFLLLAVAGSPAHVAIAQTMSLTAEQMREDLVFLRDQWGPLDRSFSPDQRETFNADIGQAIGKVHSLTPADFALEVMHAVAIPRNGHTRASIGNLLTYLPVGSWWFADGLYIITARPQFASLLGARVQRIGALIPEQALARAAPFISGTDQRIRYLGAGSLMSPDLLRRIGAIADPNDVPLQLQFSDGSSRTVHLGRVVPEHSPPAPRREPFSVLIPDAPDTPDRSPHVLDRVADRPSIYRDPVELSVAWIGDDRSVFYLRSNTLAGAQIDQKLLYDVLQAAVVPRHPKYAIVDLRLNSGGNFFNTILFAQALPRLIPPEGRIFVLIGRATFSAALVTVAMLKANGGERTILMGETMGDGSQFWAEGATSKLPNSGVEVRYSTGFHNWTGLCSDTDRCFWPVVAFGVTNASLEPQIRIEPTFADYAAGRDPVIEMALAMTK
jgi:hypothetical protein